MEGSRKTVFFSLAAMGLGVVFLVMLLFYTYFCFDVSGYGNWCVLLILLLLFSDPIGMIWRDFKVLLNWGYSLLGIGLSLFGSWKLGQVLIFLFTQDTSLGYVASHNAFNPYAMGLCIGMIFYNFFGLFLKKQRTLQKNYGLSFLTFFSFLVSLGILKNSGNIFAGLTLQNILVVGSVGINFLCFFQRKAFLFSSTLF